MPRVASLVDRLHGRKKARAQDTRSRLVSGVRVALEEAGDDIDGAALVVWDRNLRTTTTVLPGERVAQRGLPSFVRDTLCQHVGSNLVGCGEDELPDDA